MDSSEGPPAFDPILPAHDENNRRADENNRADARLQSLDKVGVIVKVELPDMHQHHDQQDDDGQTQQEGHETKSQVRLLYPPGPHDCFLRHQEQLGYYLAQAGTWKPSFNPSLQGMDRLDDLLRIKL